MKLGKIHESFLVQFIVHKQKQFTPYNMYLNNRKYIKIPVVHVFF